MKVAPDDRHILDHLIAYDFREHGLFQCELLLDAVVQTPLVASRRNHAPYVAAVFSQQMAEPEVVREAAEAHMKHSSGTRIAIGSTMTSAAALGASNGAQRAAAGGGWSAASIGEPPEAECRIAASRRLSAPSSSWSVSGPGFPLGSCSQLSRGVGSPSRRESIEVR